MGEAKKRGDLATRVAQAKKEIAIAEQRCREEKAEKTIAEEAAYVKLSPEERSILRRERELMVKRRALTNAALAMAFGSIHR